MSSVRKYIQKEIQKIDENEYNFDGLSEYLKRNNYNREVSIIEDGTKICELVEYIKKGNKLCGLVAPFHPQTGTPILNFFPADTAEQIFNFVDANERSSYIQLILAQPNNTGNFFLIIQM